MSLLKVQDLQVAIDDKHILKKLNLEIKEGETHVIMGPNGSGKSTLTASIIGNPKFTVEGGDILFEGNSIIDYTVDERARLGIFLSFQVPQEIPGLSLEEFLRVAKESVTGQKVPILAFSKELNKYLTQFELDKSYAQRSINVGFSGGEKKKSEILQMALLKPKFAILDETDSGLDVDSTKLVFNAVNKIKEDNKKMGVLVITLYSKVLKYLNPDIVHILIDGRIVKSGGIELVEYLDKHGYQHFISETKQNG